MVEKNILCWYFQLAIGRYSSRRVAPVGSLNMGTPLLENAAAMGPVTSAEKSSEHDSRV